MLYSFHHWDSFSHFFSANYTQNYLKKCYQKLELDDIEKKSYENCYPFIYYLEHGQIYYNQAVQSPLLIQPILLFYGFVHLMKACILTIDPNYPETTSVLAHGVSTRKRKKQQYRFFQDEIKFQKNGFFPHLSLKLFQINHLEGEKIGMGHLLRQIPELDDLFFQLTREKTFLPISQNEKNLLAFPKKLLDYYHMTENRFVDFIQSKSKMSFSLLDSSNDLMIKVEHTYRDLSPLKYNLTNQIYCLPTSIDLLFTFPECLIHYLLLYNLSMIARYETEWWSELIKTMPNHDYPFILSFLKITSEKGPFLAYQYLMSENKQM
ncbi:YaaC family protein [Bacillus sp. 03113]|uniref:YaaC family protein n=1 Tax=Bacillus sp. 03113 TaxID=2578211 RepID=UPI0011416A1B|nr:YaaC family protein [Bacillus sp. 03113]